MGLNDELEKVHHAISVISGAEEGDTKAAADHIESLVSRIHNLERQVMNQRGGILAYRAELGLPPPE